MINPTRILELAEMAANFADENYRTPQAEFYQPHQVIPTATGEVSFSSVLPRCSVGGEPKADWIKIFSKLLDAMIMTEIRKEEIEMELSGGVDFEADFDEPGKPS